MIDPWTWPLSWILRGLALALASIACYLIARRAGPIAGVTASASGLVLLAVLPVLLLLPGPRWKLPITLAPADLGNDRVAGPPPEVRIGPVAGRAEERAIDLDPMPDASTPSPPPRRPTPSEARRLGPEAPPTPSPPAPIEAQSRRRGDWRSGIAAALGILLVIGVSRLALGIGAVARLRSTGHRLRDPQVDELLDLLRAELSITRPVEVREAPGLGPPATIGWRRPVVLLPDDWRSWEPGELRAVLAHELAHIHRADFPVALLAQLGVALHPCNPMAYWLVGRLRLDQELAADATAARLSGGRRPYLACLARLALRRDDLASGWPARAFLPVRGTLVRRIEMLRCERSPDRDGPSRVSRCVTIASITAMALLCAGLRAPDTAEARPQDDPAPEAAPIVDDGFDLSPVPADASFVAAFRTARLATHPGLRDLIDEFDPLGNLLGGIDPRVPGLQQVTVVELRSLEARVKGGPTLVAPDLIILRTVDPVRDEQIGSILEDAEAVSYLGTRYHRARGASRSALRFDDRTLILAQKEQAIRNVIAGRDRPGGSPLWQDAADRVDDGQVLLAFETTWLSQLLGPDGNRGDLVPFGLAAMSGPMFDRTMSYAISLDVLDGMSIGAVALCRDEEGVNRVSETASALKTLARNALANIRGGAGGPEAEATVSVIKEVERLLDAATIEAEGSTVRLRAETDQDLGAFLALATRPINAARIADRRSESTKNLKRIGLAMFSYHDTHGSFPPPVLFSEDGTPYSWRVAILPFLEQTEGPSLYELYHFDEPWDGPNNRKLLERMPDVYDVPGSDNDPTHADVFAFMGPRTLMGMPGEGTRLQEIRDGSSNSLMVVESKRAIAWTTPQDIPFEIDDTDPLADLGGFWPDGFQAVFGDGSVRFIKDSIDPVTLRALVTKDGGEVVSSDRY